MEHHKKIEALNLGRTSRLVLDGIKPILDECRKSTLSRMKGEYLAGELDQIKMFSKVSTRMQILF